MPTSVGGGGREVMRGSWRHASASSSNAPNLVGVPGGNRRREFAMRRARWLAFGAALVVVLTSCGGGKKVGTAATTTPTAGAGGATTTSGPNAKCSTTVLTGTEIGVTPKTITGTVGADPGSPTP